MHSLPQQEMNQKLLSLTIIQLIKWVLVSRIHLMVHGAQMPHGKRCCLRISRLMKLLAGTFEVEKSFKLRENPELKQTEFLESE
jgi:hypothetical protein